MLWEEGSGGRKSPDQAPVPPGGLTRCFTSQQPLWPFSGHGTAARTGLCSENTPRSMFALEMRADK